MAHFHIEVAGKPPYKQDSSGAKETDTQKQRKDKLLDTIGKKAGAIELTKDPCWIRICYCRAGGKSDSANIIGGIADALEGIVFDNDRQLVGIHYCEMKGRSDRYDITVGSVPPCEESPA